MTNAATEAAAWDAVVAEETATGAAAPTTRWRGVRVRHQPSHAPCYGTGEFQPSGFPHEYCIVLAGGSRHLKSCSAQISVKILLITEFLLPQGMCCRPVVNPSRVHVATTCCPDTTGDKKGNTGSPSCTAERATIIPLRLQSCTPETT